MNGTAASCDLCVRIARTERGENPFSVARTTTGYVNLGDVQYHEGYTIFVAKRCVNELHELAKSERNAYLREMAVVAEAVFHAFKPRKLNYELLGNGAPHLHWHLFPRHAGDRRRGARSGVTRASAGLSPAVRCRRRKTWPGCVVAYWRPSTTPT